MPKPRRLMANAAQFLTIAAIVILVVRFPGCVQEPETYVNQSPQSAHTEPVEQIDLAEQFARAAVIEDLSGTVDARTGNVEMAAFRGLGLVREDSLTTGGESWASLELTEERFALVGESAEVLVTSLIDGSAENTVFYLDRGTLWVGVKDRLSPGENLTVQTPSVALSVRGTAFSISAGDSVTEVNVFAGEVDIRTQDRHGEPIFYEDGVQADISLTAGQSAAITVVRGSVANVEISERTSVNAPEDVRNKLEALMPGTFVGSGGGSGDPIDMLEFLANSGSIYDLPGLSPNVIALFEHGPVPNDNENQQLSEQFGVGSGFQRARWLGPSLYTFAIYEPFVDGDYNGIYFFADGTILTLGFSDNALQRLWGFSRYNTTKDEILRTINLPIIILDRSNTITYEFDIRFILYVTYNRETELLHGANLHRRP